MTPYQKSTPSIDAYLLKEQSRPILPGSYLKQRSLGLLLKRPPQQQEEKQDEYWYEISSWCKSNLLIKSSCIIRYCIIRYCFDHVRVDGWGGGL